MRIVMKCDGKVRDIPSQQAKLCLKNGTAYLEGEEPVEEVKAKKSKKSK